MFKIRNIFFIILFVFCINSVFAKSPEDYISYEEFIKEYMSVPMEDNCLKDYKKFIQYRREIIYNSLDLTQEQIQDFENSVQKSDDIVAQKIQEYIHNAYEIKLLKCSNALRSDINGKKKALKYIKEQIKDIHKYQVKEFQHILNSQQKSKYSMIKKLERADINNVIEPIDYHKKNIRLPYFGCPVCKEENIK